LMTFGPELYAPEEYRKMAFVVDHDPSEFRSLMPGLPNPVHGLKAEDRALYHALCVMAGNFPALLWGKLVKDFEQLLGLPPEAALPYMARAHRNLEQTRTGALTGPLVRGDRKTIARNLEALGEDPF